MRTIISIFLLLAAIAMDAQEFRFTGEFTDDTTGKVTRGAFIELSLNADFTALHLDILSSRDTEKAVTLVDTTWTRGARYRTDRPVVADNYEERDIFFLYDLNDDGSLSRYYVFSQFLDTTQPDVRQIVLRKFDADGKRLWCMTINAIDTRATEFFSILTTARKKMKFSKLTHVRQAENPDLQQRPEFDGIPQYYNRTNNVGGGSPYSSGW